MNDDDADAAWAAQQEIEHRRSLEEEDEMVGIREMMAGKYLGKSDFEAGPKLLTIQRFQQVNLAREGEKPKMKWAMYFAEEDKPLVMNPTNLQLAAQALGSEETDTWLGRKIVGYFEPSIQYQGQLVGGVRLRAARVKGESAPVHVQAQTAPGEDFSDEIPF